MDIRCHATCMRRSDGKIIDAGDPDTAVVVLPPCFSKRGLHRRYCEREGALSVSWKGFYNILEQELPYVRISVRERGLCDFCFFMRHRIRMCSDTKVMENMAILHHHLNLAEEGRMYYNDTKKDAMAVLLLVAVRLKLGI